MVNYAIALLCARLSQEVYEDFSKIRFDAAPQAKVTLIESADASDTDTQVAILHDADAAQLWVVFRGSDKDVDWITNFKFRQQTYPYGDESSSDVRFHRGFMAAYFSVRDRLQEAVRHYPDCAITVTGHSLGGALATVGALDLQYNITQHTQQPLSVYNFGAPRVGNGALVDSFRQRVPQSYRFVYGWDIVTQVPRVWQGYAHVPESVRLGPWFAWNIFSRQFKDHAITNYLEALAAKVP